MSSFNGPHAVLPFMERREIYEQTSRLYDYTRATDNPEHTKDIFQVHMVFAIGSVALVQKGLHSTTPISYYHAAMRYFDVASGLSGETFAQNTLLLFLFSLQHDVGG